MAGCVVAIEQRFAVEDRQCRSALLPPNSPRRCRLAPACRQPFRLSSTVQSGCPVLRPLKSASLPKTVISVGAIPAAFAPMMEVSSTVPPAVPFVVHKPKSPLELSPSNRTWPPRTVMALGESPVTPSGRRQFERSAPGAVRRPKTNVLESVPALEKNDVWQHDALITHAVCPGDLRCRHAVVPPRSGAQTELICKTNPLTREPALQFRPCILCLLLTGACQAGAKQSQFVRDFPARAGGAVGRPKRGGPTPGLGRRVYVRSARVKNASSPRSRARAANFSSINEAGANPRLRVPREQAPCRQRPSWQAPPACATAAARPPRSNRARAAVAPALPDRRS